MGESGRDTPANGWSLRSWGPPGTGGAAGDPLKAEPTDTPGVGFEPQILKMRAQKHFPQSSLGIFISWLHPAHPSADAG